VNVGLIAFIQKHVIDAILVIVAMVCFGLAILLYRAKKNNIKETLCISGKEEKEIDNNFLQSRFDKSTGQAQEMKEGALRVSMTVLEAVAILEAARCNSSYLCKPNP
jgi:hypothetical protein